MLYSAEKQPDIISKKIRCLSKKSFLLEIVRFYPSNRFLSYWKHFSSIRQIFEPLRAAPMATPAGSRINGSGPLFPRGLRCCAPRPPGEEQTTPRGSYINSPGSELQGALTLGIRSFSEKTTPTNVGVVPSDDRVRPRRVSGSGCKSESFTPSQTLLSASDSGLYCSTPNGVAIGSNHLETPRD